MSSRSLPVVVLLLVAALVPRLAGAQTVNGAIVGVVQDSSGAVVPDTALTLRNVTTDQTVGTTVSARTARTHSATCPLPNTKCRH